MAPRLPPDCVVAVESLCLAWQIQHSAFVHAAIKPLIPSFRIYPSTHLPIVLSFCLSFYLSFYLSLSVILLFCYFVILSFYRSIYLSFYLLFFCTFTLLFFCTIYLWLSIYRSIILSFYLPFFAYYCFIYHSIYGSNHRSIYHSIVLRTFFLILWFSYYQCIFL